MGANFDNTRHDPYIWSDNIQIKSHPKIFQKKKKKFKPMYPLGA